MHYLNWLIVAAAFVFVFCLSTVKMILDLWELDIHDSPAILEIKPQSAEDQPAKATWDPTTGLRHAQ